MRKFFQKHLPDRHSIHGNRWLRWLGPSLLHPRLWHFSRRGVAVGVALGVFFGLLIPVAQIPFAAGMAVLLRANVPIAVGSTLVTNPVTFAPIYVAAHRLGAYLLDQELPEEQPILQQQLHQPPHDQDASWPRRVWQQLKAVGKPLILGLSIIAVLAGALTYVLVMLFWRIRTTLAWRNRRARKSGKSAGKRP